MVSDTEDKDAPVTQSNNTTSKGQQGAPTVGAPGDTISLKKADVTLANITPQTDALGNNLLCGDVSFINTSNNDTLKLNGLTDWKMTDPNGVTRDMSIFGDHDYDPVELNPGGTKNGSVCFETDGAPGEYTFEFTEGLSLSNETATWKTTL